MMMISYVVLISLLLVTLGEAQIKACYAWDGSSSGNFPCDPEAEVHLLATARFFILIQSIELNEHTDPLTQHFSYAKNVTICGDGTVCPGPKNQTCCKNHQGRTELNFHNRARLPESVTGLASYYAQAGYTIPTSSATAATRDHVAQTTSVDTHPAGTTSTQQVTASSLPSKQTLAPVPSASGLSTGAKAGIGVAVGVTAMICATVAFLFYTRRRNRNWDKGSGMPDRGAYPWHWKAGDGYPWLWKDQYQSSSHNHASPELGSESAKYEADASSDSQLNSPQELAGDGIQRKA
ncbi:MAG: hypothetical protein Q9191_001055 [Dirinaria sp. TL-2023a]